MTATRQEDRATGTRPVQGGPPLGLLAVIFVGLFVAGLVVSTVLGGGSYPSPFGDAGPILSYFNQQHSAVRASGFFQFASAVPLAIYAATASARLNQLGVRAPGATIALAGGLIAAAMQAVSGIVTWVLAAPGVTAQPSTVRALHDLSFAAGGPGDVVFMGLLIAGIAVPSMIIRLMPRAWGWIGLLLALIAELSTLTLVLEPASYLLPVARFLGFVWLIVAGFMLPKARRR